MTTTVPSVDNTDLETVCLIWLDVKVNLTVENRDTQTHFRSIFHHFKPFENVPDCKQFIQQKTKDDRIFLIVSGQLGQEIVLRIHDYRQIFSIYVYCQDVPRNKEWADKRPKVKIVTNKLNVLIQQIQSDYSNRIQNKVDEPFSINISKSNKLSDKCLNNEIFHSQLLINCLLQMKTSTTDKTELINICLDEYNNNNTELSVVHEFERKYISHQVLWWYTRDSFVYRLLTKALSTKNLDLLFLFGFFIRDIKDILDKNKCKSSVQVYHGQIISLDELRTLKNSIGDYVSINKFILANCNRKPVLSSLNEFPITNDLVKTVFEIDADPQTDQSKPFANITPFHYLPQEQQVLFMLGSIFQIMDIQNDKKSGLWNVKIVLSSLKKEYDETNLISCGYLLQDMGQLHDAEKYFIRLLKEVPSNQEDFIQCYDSLGFLTFIRNNYESSLQWYQKLIQILPYDHPYLPHSFYSIGCVCQKLSNFNQAIEYYDKAIQIWQEIHGDDEPYEMAECLNNMGCIYETQKFYSTALDCHKKSLSIRDKQKMDMSSS